LSAMRLPAFQSICLPALACASGAPGLSQSQPFCIERAAFEEFRMRQLQPGLPSPCVLSASTFSPAARITDPASDSFDEYCQREADAKVGLQFDAATGIAVQPVSGMMWDGIHPY